MNRNFRPKNQLLHPEKVIKDIEYAVTFSPNDQAQHFGEKYSREDKFYDGFVNWFNENIRFCHLTLNLEISSKGRLHWHGILKVKDVARFYMYDVPEILLKNTFVVKEIREALEGSEYESWDAYCHKQQPLFPDYQNVKFIPLEDMFKGRYEIKDKLGRTRLKKAST